MPKQIPRHELDAVLKAVKQLPEVPSLKKIHEALDIALTRRTLQRRLDQLIDQKKLIREGRKGGSRYRVPEATMQIPGVLPYALSGGIEIETYIPVSPEGQEIRQKVSLPLQNRRPVGYNRGFLDDYLPNTTFYLPPELREELRNKGQSPLKERPAGTGAKRIFNRLLLDLTWNSSRLEGNTYSLIETLQLLELGDAAEGKQSMETQMILNHKAAIELLVDHAEDTAFNRYTILSLHALLSDNLLGDPSACGRLRSIPVGIGKSVYHPLEVPQLIDECFRQILDTAAAIIDPFEQAFFAMVHLPYLQPFEDVNKRVSRLAANIPLIRKNLCPLSFTDVPAQAYIDGLVAVYELNRIELLRDVFAWAYDRSCALYAAGRRSLGEPDHFRLRYRSQILGTVKKTVLERMDRKAAVRHIRRYAQEQIPWQDQAKFLEVVERELLSLHEGNIARFQLRPGEFREWLEGWR